LKRETKLVRFEEEVFRISLGGSEALTVEVWSGQEFVSAGDRPAAFLLELMSAAPTLSEEEAARLSVVKTRDPAASQTPLKQVADQIAQEMVSNLNRRTGTGSPRPDPGRPSGHVRVRLLVGLFVCLLLILLGSAFYWFEVRPGLIRSACIESERGKNYTDYQLNNYYRVCLGRHGLKPESLIVGTP
jgi:hypothetical protein